MVVNYRLGPLGFLSLGDDRVNAELNNHHLGHSYQHCRPPPHQHQHCNDHLGQVPGNMGLRDQVMALSWVQVAISLNHNCFGISANSPKQQGPSKESVDFSEKVCEK